MSGTEPADPVMEKAWEVIVRCEDRLRRALRVACRSACHDARLGASLVDDAWTEVVLERARRVVELFDPGRGDVKRDLDNYFVGTMKLYARKWAARRMKFVSGRVPRAPGELIDSQTGKSDGEREWDATFARTDLNMMLSNLSDYDQWLIRSHELEGYTFAEMRDAYDHEISRGTVRNHFNVAMARLEEVADAERERRMT